MAGSRHWLRDDWKRHVYLEQSLQTVAKWVHANWEDGQVMDEKIEII